MILYNLLPEKFQPYAKAWVAAIGTILSGIVLVIPDSPDWITVAVALLTTWGVYQVPNDTTGKHVAEE